MKIATYMRYSTQKQELVVQRDEITKYLKYTFPQNTKTIKEYIDEGYSGKDMNRNSMERLKNDIISGNIDTVIALKLDRLSRSMQDLLVLFNFFEQHKIKVHIIKDKIDTSTAQGRLMFQIMGAFAEFERETIRERLEAGRKYARENNTRSGKPMHRPRKIFNVKECIELYKKGMSLNKLGKLYNVHSLTIKSRLKEHNIL